MGAKITNYEALIRAQLGDGPPDPPTGGITNGGFESATTGWTAPLTPGHSYTLTLVNRDDNHPADPVSTLFDDVTVDAGTQQARQQPSTTQRITA